MNFEKNAQSAQTENSDKSENSGLPESVKKYIRKITLKGAKKDLVLDNNVWLAPLAGVTDLAFRLICKQCGSMIANDENAAPGLVFTEMISAKGLHYKGNNSIRLADSDPRERPLSVQIFGSEPDIMAESAAMLCGLGADAIDINMGCPMPKITSNSEGSALLTNPARIEKIVSAVVSASSAPVTVKIRRGFESPVETCAEAAIAAEAGGAAAVTVHGRFRDQYYSGKCDIGAIERVKKAVKIPVIGNGDITSARAALEMFESTGCDGIMIGRAALGRPWIFYELLAENAKKLSAKDILNIIKLHIEYTAAFKGEEQGVREMRKHLAWYTKGMPHAAETRDKIFKARTAEEAVSLIERYFGGAVTEAQ